MPQPNFSEFSEYQPRKERRLPLPITNLPVNAISASNDPTEEIRTLIEELQKTARESRAQVRAAEADRADCERQLEGALGQIEQLRVNERELRSQFMEVSSILRERDEAVLALEKVRRAEKEASEKLTLLGRERNDLARQRDESVRQRDELQRKADVMNRSVTEAVTRTAEAQRQVTTIRQARDTAHAQNLELTNKASRLEDELAELGYQRDAAKKAQKQAQIEAAEYRRQLDMLTTDRDATQAQVEQLSRELDEQRKKLLDLAQQKSAAAEADSEQGAALEEARAQVASISQERDAARQRAVEQARELEEIRAQFQTFREVESQAISNELEAARGKLTALETQAREARHEAANLQQQTGLLREQVASLQRSVEETAAQKAEAEARLATVSEECAAALSVAQAAQGQVEEISHDRETLRQQAVANAAELEAQLATLRVQIDCAEEAQVAARAWEAEVHQSARRFEKQRLEMLEVVTRLQAAQQQIRELSASLAETRLQMKFSAQASRAKSDRAFEEDLASEARAPDGSTLPPIEEPLTEKEAKGALAAMRHCFLSFNRDAMDLSLLNELHCHIHGFSERARTSNFVALHRLGRAFADLTRGMYENPDRINGSSTQTIGQTIELLALLTRERLLGALRDPATARVYVVDDDLENCHAIQMALHQEMIQTASAQDPSCALMELASEQFDLIFLDVVMPEMDGFELCQQIRALPFHAATPIVFLTGLTSAEDRVQSGLSGGNDFIGKPFNLAELSVKALTLILKGQLAPA